MTEKNDKKKDSILDAAETLFAKWGYEGSSTRSIAAEAGVNMAMLNYYFGSKDGLYKAVLERRLSGFRQTLASIASKKMSSWEKLKLAVDTYADRVLSNNCFHKIISRQLSLEQRSDMAEFIAENVYKNISQIKLIINEGINNGSFNKDVDVEMLVATIFGIKYYLVNSSPIASQLFNMNLQDPEIMAKEINPRVKTYIHNLLNVYLIKHDTEN
ncbi:TetR/AcrR family transcriptional regulator (plasmid) [Pedobacter sp. BS3]|uniref:TetR/AcrR family transcriptional regulator n=1 Tax=Pedobacter sp. BS3 TaxID=2567937 RepID=UPI0011EBDD75|nr:TetR/AcrR family transcriptional regulator [Pedobacter sp. BS3]TZF85883.1 TetR/AcrR family transcriptional regulator [Pedobacter sp. BS3]